MVRNVCRKRIGSAAWWRTVATACSVFALACGSLTVAHAQENQQQPPPPEPPIEQPEANERQIVVIGRRVIVTALEDVQPEQEYDVSTVGELLGEIREENGDDDPAVLINGQPVRDLGDLADFPVEAVERIEQLPRGAAQRIGGSTNERAYNVVLRPEVKSATLTVSREIATEGDWGQNRREALATYVRDNDRVNLTLRHTDSDILLESDRGIVPRAQFYPFSQLGNVVPFTGSSQVDPVLSGAVGQPVTVVALNGAPLPTLADLLAGANRTNPSGTDRFRSLRSASSRYEAGLAGNKVLTPWLSLSFNGRLSWSDSDGLRGLPSGRFLLPANNAFTPFSTPVFLTLNDPARPLRSHSDTTTKSLSATLNANFGDWYATLAGSINDRDTETESDLNGSFSGGFDTIEPGTNPFADNLAALIPVTQRSSTSSNLDRQLAADAAGTLFLLPSGPVQGRAGVSALWTSFKSNDSLGSLAATRRELVAKVGVTIPLTSETFLPALGSSELALDYGEVDVGRFGNIERYSVALNWSPAGWLRVTAAQFADGTPIYPELLAAPADILENVPYFDPLRSETVDVRLISGGAAGLRNERERTRTLSLTANPLPKYNLQLSAEYQDVLLRDQLGNLPEPSSAVVAAFPDRFIRDAAGQLVVVDTRAINFARERTSQLRLGIGFTIPLVPSQTFPPVNGVPRVRTPATTLQVALSHTYLIDSTLLIRDGLPEVDLLDGGAIGVRGGKLRNLTTASLALSRGATGLRLSANWRGASYLITGTTGSPDRLRFGSLPKFDLRVFADLGQLMPEQPVAKGTRISLIFENAFNDRQIVRNRAGITPEAYLPERRDPVGRTVMFELRKVF